MTEEVFKKTDEIISQAIGVKLETIEEYLEMKKKYLGKQEEPVKEKKPAEKQEKKPIAEKVETTAKEKSSDSETKQPLF